MYNRFESATVIFHYIMYFLEWPLEEIRPTFNIARALSGLYEKKMFYKGHKMRKSFCDILRHIAFKSLTILRNYLHKNKT